MDESNLQQSQAKRTPKDWGQPGGSHLIFLGLGLAALAYVVFVGLTMCSAPHPPAAMGNRTDDPYDIVEKRVESAFGVDGAETSNVTNTPPPAYTNAPKQEEQRQGQAPSVLPENPPAPAPLGKY